MDAEVELGLRARRQRAGSDEVDPDEKRRDDDGDRNDDDWFDLNLGWDLDSAISAVTSEATKIMESAATYDILSALQENPTDGETTRNSDQEVEDSYHDSDFFYHIPVPTPIAAAAAAASKIGEDKAGGSNDDVDANNNNLSNDFFESPPRSILPTLPNDGTAGKKQPSQESPWDWGDTPQHVSKHAFVESSPIRDRELEQGDGEYSNHGSLLLSPHACSQYSHVDSDMNSEGRPVHISDGMSVSHAAASSSATPSVRREKQVDFFGFEIADSGGGEVASMLLDGLLGGQTREQSSASRAVTSSSSAFGIGDTALSTVNSAVSTAISFFDNIDEEIDLSEDAILRQIKINKERLMAVPTVYATFIPSIFGAAPAAPPSPAKNSPAAHPFRQLGASAAATGSASTLDGGAEQQPSTLYFLAIRLVKTVLFVARRIALFASWLIKEAGIICFSSLAITSSERNSFTVFSASDVTREQRVRRVLLYVFSRLTHTYGIICMGLLLLTYSYRKFSKMDPTK